MRPLHGNRLKSYTLFTPEAASLFARMTTPPTPARARLINNTIRALIVAGVWQKFDAFGFSAAADSQAASLNWVANQYNPAPVNAPTFVADRGYTGNGTSSYLDPSYTFGSVSSPKFTQNSGHLGLWSLTNLEKSGARSTDMGFVANSYLARNTGVSGQAIGRPNMAASATWNGAYPGHVVFSRSAAAVWEAYSQGVDTGGGTGASATPSGALRIGAGNMDFGVNQIAAWHWGSDLTAADVLATYNAVHGYLVGVGAV